MTSLAMRHRARMMARKNAEGRARRVELTADTAVRLHDSLTSLAQRAAPHGSAATEYELQRVQLGEDLRALSEIQSIEAKIERKAELLPRYDAWCDGVIIAAAAAEAEGKLLETDDVLVQTMIWAIDCADAARALPRARLVLRHGMDLPGRFERTAGCMIAEEFAETALKAMGTDKLHIADRALLLEIADLTEDHDMPDQARAKLHKAIGMSISRAVTAAIASDSQDQGPAGGPKAGIEAALAHFRRALALNDKSGVKKMIEIAERALTKLAEDTTD